MSEVLIFVDVDGVLNPLRTATHELPVAGYRWIPTCPSDQQWWGCKADLWVRLNHRHGDWLNGLAAEIDGELVWGTGWQSAANDWIGPNLDLPEMPWVPIPERTAKQRARFTFGEWKAWRITDYANGRPFIWFDDEPDAMDAAEDLSRGPHLVVRSHPGEGLMARHIDRARNWAHRLAGATV